MKKIYTCFVCGFPFAMDEKDVPELCPSCNSPRSNYLEEPWTEGGIEARRIHVDVPKPDPNWDKYNIKYHHPKHFPDHSRHGRIKAFVYYYDTDVTVLTDFYAKEFGWDFIEIPDSNTKYPLVLCATGPGRPNWEPRFPSFGYGVLMSKEDDPTDGLMPQLIIEVDDIEATKQKVLDFGGKVLTDTYLVSGDKFCAVCDQDGRGLYLKQTPDDVDWDAPESSSDEQGFRYKKL